MTENLSDNKYDVFLSYSSQDKSIADTIIASFEQVNIRCWYAPRDIQPGMDWAKAIIYGIQNSSTMVLIFSSHADHSQHVLDEVNFAISEEKPIIPFRVENLEPSGALRLHLSSRHWLDAYVPSWQTHVDRLVKIITAILKGGTSPEEETLVPPQRKPAIRKRRLPVGVQVLAAMFGLFVLAAVGTGIYLAVTKLSHRAASSATPPPSSSLPEISENSPGSVVAAGLEISENSPHPVIATGLDGKIHLTWAEPVSGKWVVQYISSIDSGFTFSQPVSMNPGGDPIAQQHPAMVLHPGGAVQIAWEENQNGNWDIYYASSNNGTKFSQAVQVNGDSASSNQIQPAMAIGSNGAIFLAWQDDRNGNWDIYAARSGAAGSAFEPEIKVNDETSGQQVTPVIGIDSQGGAHVAWASDSSGTWAIYSTRLERKVFRHGLVVGSGLMFDLSNQLPSLAMGSGDSISIAWANAYIREPKYNALLYLPVYAVSSDAGETFSDPRQVGEGYSHVSTRAPETGLAVGEGSIHVVLTTYSPRDGSLVWYYRSDSGGTFRAGVMVAQAAGGDAMHTPQVAVDGNGHIHIVWAHQRGNEWDVYYSRSTDGGANFSDGVKVSGRQ